MTAQPTGWWKIINVMRFHFLNWWKTRSLRGRLGSRHPSCAGFVAFMTLALFFHQPVSRAEGTSPSSKVTDYKEYLKLELARLDQMLKVQGLQPEAKRYIEERKKDIEARMSNASEKLPAGQMVEFMNTRAFGSKFVYVIDKSRSMAGKRLRSAKAELMRSLENYSDQTQFYVIFYDTKAYEMPGGSLFLASKENKALCKAWVDRIHAEGKTDPSSALIRAIKLDPDGIFLLSDGLFDDSIPSLIKVVKNNSSPSMMVNTIAFMSDEGSSLLERIARENSGQYIHIMEKKDKKPNDRNFWWPFRFWGQEQ